MLLGRAVLAAATSGNPKFFLGTDSAPHEVNRKVRLSLSVDLVERVRVLKSFEQEASCGCAGIFSAPVALSIYAEAFEEVCLCADLLNIPLMH